MNACKIPLIILLTALLYSCKGGGGGGGSESSSFQDNLLGTWDGECISDVDYDYKETISILKSKMISISNYYPSGSNCTDSIESWKYHRPANITESRIKLGSMTGISLTLNADHANIANLDSACGMTDWVGGQEKDIFNCYDLTDAESREGFELRYEIREGVLIIDSDGDEYQYIKM